jgi:hypothetical protein
MNLEIAALRFEYFELLSANRAIAMKLFGYRSTNPERFTEEIARKMELYVFAGRKSGGNDNES